MQPTTKNVYEVQVAGLPMKLRSSHDEETVQELIQIVNSKVNDAMAANKTISFQNALAIATLNMAEELLLLKKTARRELDRVEERARTILDQVEEISSAT